MLYGNINCGCSDCGDCEDLIFTSPDDSILIEKDGCEFEFSLVGAITNTPITPVDTQSVNLTVSGTNNHTLQADVKISEDAGNNIQLHADGLYVGGDALYTDANARAALSATAPLVYNNLTGVFSIPVATALVDGYLDNADFVTFNNKIDGGLSLGGTHDIFTGVASKILQFRGLTAGSNISITPSGNFLTIAAAAATEVDTLATVVARGGTVNLPISIQGLTISNVPTAGSLADDILVRTAAGQVRIIPTSSFLTAEADTLDDVTGRGDTTTNDITVNELNTTVDANIGGDLNVTGDALITGDVTADGLIANALALNSRTVIIDDAITDDDFVVLVDTSGGNVTLTIDPVALAQQVIIIVKTSFDTNQVILSPDSGLIDGSATYVFSTGNQSVMIQSNGVNFNIISSRNSLATAQFYMVGNGTATVVADTTTFVKVLGTTLSVSGVANDFDLSTPNRVLYTGTLGKLFKVSGHADLTAGNSESISVRLAVNGTTLPESQAKITTPVGGLFENIGFEALVELVAGDYVEVFIRNNTAVTNITVTDLNLTINNVN